LRSWSRFVKTAHLRRGMSCLLVIAAIVCAPPGRAQSIDDEVHVSPFALAVEAEEGPIAAPAAPDERAAPEAPEKAAAPANPWSKVPAVRPMPRLGNFPIPPSGPGYYSLHDWLHGITRKQPPKYPYPPSALIPYSFFDADFRYLEDPKNTQHDLFDPLHRMHLGDCWLLATGGQVWTRYMHEVNSRLTGRNNDYQLLRTRAYLDLCYTDSVRAYAEFLDGRIFDPELPPLAIDQNPTELLNCFVDLKVCDWEDHPVYVRTGRQELLLGSQRLVSPLDWAVTRRTFEGVRVFRTGEKHDLDVFWSQPVVPDATRFDVADHDRNFVGLWSTWRPEKGHFFDTYYLWLGDTSPVRTVVNPRGTPFDVHTLGTRYAGQQGPYLWDVEAMLEFGEFGQRPTVAGATTVSGGYHFEHCAWNPTAWICYDFASGSADPLAGAHYSTFNQLFPFGHYYLGWLDLVGRQNIHDINAHLWLYPAKWITIWTQYHHFALASRTDALYGAGGAPLRWDPTGRAGRSVGDEIDLVVNFHLGAHSDILMGYSHLFAGPFIRRTAPNPAAAQSPDLFYAMYSFRW
jgi:hypothetical protein